VRTIRLAIWERIVMTDDTGLDFLATGLGLVALFSALTGTVLYFPRYTFRIERYPIKASWEGVLWAVASLASLLLVVWICTGTAAASFKLKHYRVSVGLDSHKCSPPFPLPRHAEGLGGE
jgi:hypothetical protein